LRARYVPRSVSVYARFSDAIRSVCPMPVAASTYHAPAGLSPACCQRSISSRFVPDLSPREMKREPLAAIRLSAFRVVMPFTPAGSAGGPTTMKSLCMKRARRSPLPWSMKSCSAFGA